jgi:hypothetical protein
MSDIGIKFIQDYHEGKYGYAVRDEMKALMFYRATFLETEDQRRSMLWAFENSIGGDGRCAWVGPDGDIIYVQHGHHLAVAEHIFMTSEGEFEKIWAKITRSTKSPEDALKYVENPTRRQKRFVEETFYNHRKES